VGVRMVGFVFVTGRIHYNRIILLIKSIYILA